MKNDLHGLRRTSWLSLHLRCDGDIDEFLRTCLFDLVDELVETGVASSWFFLRYWEGGPHVRLRLAVGPEDRRVTESVQARARSWLDEHDPGFPLDLESYARIARQLGAREGKERGYLSWRPHGETWQQDYVPECAKYGHGTSLAAFERHFQESSELTVRALRRRPSFTGVLTLCTLLVISGWAGVDEAGPGRQPRTQLIDRWGFHDPPGWRPPAQVDAAMLGELRERALSGRDPWCRDWLDSLGRLHEVIVSDPTFPAARRCNGMDICHHLLCNRLGLTPGEELIVRRSAWTALQQDVEPTAKHEVLS